MSSKALAARYSGRVSSNPEPADPGLFGPIQGLDLFGIQKRRQNDAVERYKQFMQFQQGLSTQGEKDVIGKQGEEERKSTAFQQAVDILKAKGIIANDANIKKYDDATTDQRVQIATIENQIEKSQGAAQLQQTESPEGQAQIKKSQQAVLAKPQMDQNQEIAGTRKISAIDVPPNTGVNYFPQGDPNQPSANAFGANQKITTVGGITDPKTGQLVGGRPVETYGQAKFPAAMPQLRSPSTPPLSMTDLMPFSSMIGGQNPLSGQPDANAAAQQNAGTKPVAKPMPTPPSTAITGGENDPYLNLMKQLQQFMRPPGAGNYMPNPSDMNTPWSF